MATEVGEVTIGVKFDKNSLTSGVKQLGTEAQKAGNTISSRLGGAAKTAGAAIAGGLAAGSAAFASLAKSSLDAYADYEQLTGGVETLFAESAAEIQSYEETYGKTWDELKSAPEGFTTVADNVLGYANEAFKTAGMSANEYMETVTSFSASLRQSVGDNASATMEYANTAVTDMADNANKMGTSMELIQNAYQGFAKQNYTMLDNLKLGYGGTQAEMARLINDSGVLGDTITVTAETVNEVGFDKIIEAIHTVQTEMGITGTTAAEASGTVSGSIASMGASWENVLASFGSGNDNAIQLALKGFIESIGNVLSNLSVLIEPIMNGIVTLINTLVPMLPQILQMILPPLLQGAVALITGLVQALPTLITPENIQMVINAGIQLFMALVQALPQIVQALANALPTIIDTLVQWLTDPATIATLLGAAVQLFFALVMAVPQILGSLLNVFGSLVGSLWNGITQLFGEFAANFGSFLGGIFKGAINGVIGFIEGFLNTPINLINGFIGIINGTFGWLGVNLGTIELISLPRLAEGGFATGATTAMIGEAGAEMVMPLTRNTDAWAVPIASLLADELNGGSGGNGTPEIVQNNYINSNVDMDKIENGLTTALRRAAA